ncbi:MAG: FtsX-like permease family protein [Methanomassiliicoccales archaeon]|nr:FtsX-like permease family protein [Methanomassiliicoccales archaeon]MDD1755376.1 FtsX-like permease family protein [Methanomassiliicoccales archaeon]
MSKLSNLGTLIVGAVAIVLCFLFLPGFVALLAGIVIVVVIVMLDARRHRVLFTMALRNLARRKGTTALVIGGLMVGTAIISTSFVVGDTMDNMIVKQTTTSLGEVDFSVGSPNAGYAYFDDSFIGPLSDEFAAIPNVEASNALLRDNVAILNNVNQLSNPTFSLMGLNDTVVQGFGHFYDLDGAQVSSAPQPMEVYLNEMAAKDIDAHQGDSMTIFINQYQFAIATVSLVVQDRGLGAFGSGNTVYMDIASAQVLTGHPGQSNFVFISLQGAGDSGLSYADQVRTDIEAILGPIQESTGLKIVDDKAQEIADARTMADLFTSMFFVFGAFSIIAGVTLVVNIFTMLSEERKGEMGVARAIGMKREQLRRLFTYEGTLYAALAAAVGSVLGLLLAYVIVWAMSGIFQFGEFSFNLVEYFTFTPMSLILAYLGGFALTIVTVYFATQRISTLNIVRAIRSIPEPPVPRKDRRAFRVGILLLVGGALLLALGIWQEKLAYSNSGLSLMTISLGFILRRVTSERLAWSLAGVLTLIVWLPLPFGLRIFPYEADIEGYVVAGLFLVVGALLIIMFNSDSLIHILTKLFRVRKEYRAVLKTAISYPLKAKFRTALSIFIFGLVIFTMTTLSVMSGMMSVNIDRMVGETSGGFDVISFTTTSPILDDPWERLNQTGSPLNGDNVSSLVPLPVSMATIGYTAIDPTTQEPVSKETGYQVMGFDSNFYTLGNYPLADYNHTLYSSDTEVWKAVQADSSLVIFDGSVAPQTGLGAGFGPPDMGSSVTLRVGQVVSFMNPVGVVYNLTVAGIMKQSAMQGAFMGEQVVRTEFFAYGYSLLLVKFQPGLDTGEQAVLLEKAFLANGLQTIDVQALARQITSLVNSMFTLFEAFLAMGLIVGISGLGIITIRSIHERRIEIGMMRAIGYRKSMVVANFAIESAFISLLGIVIGTVLGIVVGYELWLTSLQAEGFIWYLDLWPILFVAFLSFAATILSVYPAARGASKVSPAEVLRFE